MLFRSSWIWVGVFGFRLAVQLPLYFAGDAALGALGFAKIVMGWPLFLAGAYVTYRVLRPVYVERRAANEEGAPPETSA